MKSNILYDEQRIKVAQEALSGTKLSYLARKYSVSPSREDGHQASGLGNEFNVIDMPETATTAFAEQRVQEGYCRFRLANLSPHFWEAPHYHTTPEQDKVFRSHFDLFYQPDVTIDPNPPAAQYENVLNKGFGNMSLGKVFVPTTLSYIPSGKDEKFILNQMGKMERINSFFFQRLITQIYLKGYPFYSIHDYVPFAPSAKL